MCALADAVPERRIGFRLADVAMRDSGWRVAAAAQGSPDNILENNSLTFSYSLASKIINLSIKDT